MTLMTDTPAVNADAAQPASIDFSNIDVPATKHALIVSEETNQRQQLAYLNRRKWIAQARDNQVTEGFYHKWTTAMWLAGRGFGKTRVGAEETLWHAVSNPAHRIAIVARTWSDVRDTCFEGVSGLMSIVPPEFIKDYNKSLLELTLFNDTIIKGFTSEKPDSLRGPQHHFVWADELAAWRYLEETLDQIYFGLRLGDKPRLIITTTPRPVKGIRNIIADYMKGDGKTLVVRGSTFDNAANLASTALERLKARYEGTRLGRQELYAEVLDAVAGALWNYALLDKQRVDKPPCDLVRIVVAIDPAVSSNDESAETGIVAVGIGTDGNCYVLNDSTQTMAAPEVWAKAAVNLYTELDADIIVGEVNNGGDLVESVVRAVDPNVSFKSVRASRGKITRAEPVSALYSQGKVFHCGAFAEMEDQMCTFVAGVDQKSPDRLDALVWAVTELKLIDQEEESWKPPEVAVISHESRSNPFAIG